MPPRGEGGGGKNLKKQKTTPEKRKKQGGRITNVSSKFKEGGADRTPEEHRACWEKSYP